MRVTVQLLPTRKETRTIELPENSSVEQVIRALGLLPDGWIALRREEPLPIDAVLVDKDELRLFSVVSGG